MSAPTAPGRNQSRWKGAVRRLVAAVVCVLGFLPVLAGAAEKTLPTSIAELELSFAPLVKKAAPAVVNIYATKAAQQLSSPLFDDPFFRRFFSEVFPSDPMGPGQNSLGSGVIVRIDGLIVTNYHVVKDADAINVVLADRREFPAEVLRMDERTDLAVVKIDVAGERLPFLELMDSDAIEVGDLVLAIGNPFGVGQTVSSGIVSGLARSGAAENGGQGYFIQTDAPINPGNSGGALIDTAGQLIGVNTSILTRSGGSNGIGFAIPADLVAAFVAQARAGEVAFSRPWAGLAGQPVDADMAGPLGLDRPGGIIVSGLHRASPFNAAGLQVGDVIVSVDDQPVNTPSEMVYRMSVAGLGHSARVGVRRDGVLQEMTVALIAAPDEPDRAEVTLGTRSLLPGLRAARINPAVISELNLPLESSGVVVMDAGRYGPRVGLRDGDVILSVNGVEVAETHSLAALLSGEVRRIQMVIQRGDRRVALRFRG